MNALIYSIFLQCKLDLRNKNVLIAYYILPLVFFIVMGSVFSSIGAISKEALIPSMTILSISMAAFLGTPAPLVEFFASDAKKTYKVGNIKLWVMLLTTFISGLIHMLIVSIIIYITGPMVFDGERPSNLGIYFGLIMLIISVNIIIGMLIGLIAKKNTTMTLLSQLVFLPSMLIGGIMFPLSLLPDVLGKIGNILPAPHSIKALTSLDNVSLGLVSPLLLIGAIALVFLFIMYRKVQVD